MLQLLLQFLELLLLLSHSLPKLLFKLLDGVWVQILHVLDYVFQCFFIFNHDFNYFAHFAVTRRHRVSLLLLLLQDLLVTLQLKIGLLDVVDLARGKLNDVSDVLNMELKSLNAVLVFEFFPIKVLLESTLARLFINPTQLPDVHSTLSNPHRLLVTRVHSSVLRTGLSLLGLGAASLRRPRRLPNGLIRLLQDLLTVSFYVNLDEGVRVDRTVLQGQLVLLNLGVVRVEGQVEVCVSNYFARVFIWIFHYVFSGFYDLDLKHRFLGPELISERIPLQLRLHLKHFIENSHLSFR